MTYKENKSLKIFHCHGLETLPDKEQFNGILELGIDTFVVKKGLFPIIVEWRFRLYDNDKIVLSCLAQHRLLLKFDFNEYPVSDTMKMLDDSKNLFSEKFKKKVVGTRIEGNDLSSISDEAKFNKACQILEIAKKQGLIE